jgi:ubiquinone/menaquinone biosynthesis C-methylase UbiE
MSILSAAPPALPNHDIKEDIRLYWSKRAVTFDQSAGHRIEDEVEAPAWRALFSRAFGDLSGRRVLDLACGTGEISRMLLAMGAEVTGVDFAEPMLERARAKHRDRAFRARLADVEDLRLEADASYDAIVTRHLVWTLVDPDQAFHEWLRVLKPGGRLLVVDGDWVNTPALGRLMRAAADRLAPRAGTHGDGADLVEHRRLLAQVRYREGLAAGRLSVDLASAGFERIESLPVARLYFFAMRRAPLADWLRLNASRRFALLCRRPVAG